MREHHPLNVPGDFYAEFGGCVLCGAPEQEAGDLMSRDDDGCYFQRQPQTPAEVEAACRAVWSACWRCLRYAGTEPAILQRLGQLGMADRCDH